MKRLFENFRIWFILAFYKVFGPKPPKQKWSAAYVQCDVCYHKYTTVFPAGLDALECPHCGSVCQFTEIPT